MLSLAADALPHVTVHMPDDSLCAVSLLQTVTPELVHCSFICPT